jgi:hypothetical protein
MSTRRKTLNKISTVGEVDGNHVVRKYMLKTSTSKCTRKTLRYFG